MFVPDYKRTYIYRNKINQFQTYLFVEAGPGRT
jgi:hypothetical protein